jgi:adenylate cyclase
MVKALYLFEMDQHEAAIAEFAEAVRLDDQNPLLYWHYGNVYYVQGDLEPAAELWEKAIEVDPENARIVQILPQIYVSMGRESDARRAYERALGVAERYLELNPADLSARLNRASGLMALGRREEAFEQAQSVIESGSQDQRILYNTACFYSLAGEVELALETLTKTVDAGYAAADWARSDSDLDSIRQDPRFEQLLERMEANRREDGADGDPSTSR